MREIRISDYKRAYELGKKHAEDEVTSTTNHPDSSYGKAVWVDKEGNAYCQVGMEAPFYTIITVND